MSLLELYARRKEALSLVGEAVREEARATGTTFSYIDPEYRPDIVTGYPDGRRVIRKRGGLVVPISARVR